MNRLTGFVRAAACAAAVVFSCSAEAQTFAELQAAVNAAESGSTVYVENDMTFDAPLDVPDGKTITVEGRDGVVTLSRDTEYKAGLFFTVPAEKTAHLTLKNLVLDLKCNSAQIVLTDRVVNIDSDKASFTLGSGAKVYDACVPADHAGCLFTRWGLIVMEEGSEISHVYHYSYGVAVLAGWNSAGLFKMNGGLITDCHTVGGSTWPSDYGGMVYVWGGKFFFNGGVITGNESTYYNGGVVLVSGSNYSTANGNGVLYLGGHGVITGNVGKVSNDVYCCNADQNIWLINGSGGMPHTTDCHGPILTVKTQTQETLGSQCKSTVFRFGVEGMYSNFGSITSQDDPTMVLGYLFDASVSKWYPTWVKKVVTAKTDDQHWASDDLTAVLGLVNGKKATIALADDVEYARTSAFVPADKSDWLLTSVDARKTIKMPDDAAFGLFNLSDGGDTVKKLRLENIVIDGNRDGGAYIPAPGNGAGDGLFRLERGATLELGPGATICNGKAESGCAGIRAVALSTIRMEEGAVISNMVAKWCMAVLLGNGGAAGDFPVFDMKGGLITDCHCVYEGTGNGYGGAVYLWHGILNMSGGAITGNDAPSGGTAGVHLETTSASQLNLSGTARICNNTGRDMDVFNRGCSISYSGDFRGLVGISVNSQSTNVGPVDEDTTGAWCFYRSSNDPAVDRTKWGYLVGDSVKWGEPVGTIDEYGFVQTSDIDIRLSDAEDLSTAEARAKLPHVLGGAALNGNIAQTLTFDSEEMRDSGDLPLCLYKFDDGAFAGTATFTTPTEGKLRWKVSQLTLADVSGLYLERDKPGLMILFR